jgi:hypothetical protein
MEENPIPVHFEKNPERTAGNSRTGKEPVGFWAVIWLVENFENRGESSEPGIC